MMGSMMDMKQGFFPFMFNFGAAAREEKLIQEKADSILEFIGLKDLADEYPANMPYGKQADRAGPFPDVRPQAAVPG